MKVMVEILGHSWGHILHHLWGRRQGGLINDHCHHYNLHQHHHIWEGNVKIIVSLLNCWPKTIWLLSPSYAPGDPESREPGQWDPNSDQGRLFRRAGDCFWNNDLGSQSSWWCCRRCWRRTWGLPTWLLPVNLLSASPLIESKLKQMIRVKKNDWRSAFYLILIF